MYIKVETERLDFQKNRQKEVDQNFIKVQLIQFQSIKQEVLKLEKRSF